MSNLQRSVFIALLAGSACAGTARATPVVTLFDREAFLGSTDYGPAGDGNAPPAVIAGETLTSDTALPPLLTLIGSDAVETRGGPPAEAVNTMTAQWSLWQTYAASGSTLSASGDTVAASSGSGCNIGGCFVFDGGGKHNNRQTLYFTVSEDTAYSASGYSDSQQIIDVERWTGSGWVVYRGLDGNWDPFVTYNAGLDGADPHFWSRSSTFLAGTYRIYNKRDFYVGNTDVGWSYEIDFGASATVVAVPEPGAYALMLAGLGVLGWVVRRRAGGAI